jgi:hypothetical protein
MFYLLIKEKETISTLRDDLFSLRLRAPTLEFAVILNARTIHEGTPLYDFSIFAPLHFFFGNFFAKLESTTLNYSKGPYSGQSLNGKGEFDF